MIINRILLLLSVFLILTLASPEAARAVKCDDSDITWITMTLFEYNNEDILVKIKGRPDVVTGKVQLAPRKVGKQEILEVKIGDETVLVDDIEEWFDVDSVDEPSVLSPAARSSKKTKNDRVAAAKKRKSEHPTAGTRKSGSVAENAAGTRNSRRADQSATTGKGHPNAGKGSKTNDGDAPKVDRSEKALADDKAEFAWNSELARVYVDRGKLFLRDTDIQKRTEALTSENPNIKANSRRVGSSGGSVDGFSHTIGGVKIDVAEVTYEMPVRPSVLFEKMEAVKKELKDSDFHVKKVNEYLAEGYNAIEAKAKADKAFVKELSKRADQLFLAELSQLDIIAEHLGSYKTAGGNAIVAISKSNPDDILVIKKPYQVNEDTFSIEILEPTAIAEEIQFSNFRRDALKVIRENVKESGHTPRWKVVEGHDDAAAKKLEKYGIVVRPYKRSRTVAASRTPDNIPVNKRSERAKPFSEKSEAIAREFKKDIEDYEVEIISLGEARFGIAYTNELGPVSSEVGAYSFKVGIDQNFGNNMTEDGYVFDW